MRFEIESTTVVHAAPPGAEQANSCIPNTIRLHDGTILLSTRVGVHRESSDGRIELLRSLDDGQTWEHLGRPFERWVPSGWDMRGAGFVQLASGGVLCTVITIDKTQDRPVYNPNGEGIPPIQNWIARSEDRGSTWDAWPMTNIPVRQSATQGLVELPSGDLLVTFETFKEYDEPGPWREVSGVLRSRDGGRTWGEMSVAGASDLEGDPHDTMWFDPRIATLSDGRLVLFFYAFRHGTTTDGPNHVSWSSDGGRSWTKPAPTNLLGQATYPIALPDGAVAIFQQRRTEPQVMVAAYSADGGRTFDPGSETVVYRHELPSAAAADGSLKAQEYLTSMAKFTFGHPTGVALGRDRIFVAWYAGTIDRSQIRGATLRLRG